MLFGTPPTQPAANATTATAHDFIFDVTTADFETKIMKASMEAPVLVDFWAPWCGPCKQLMPVLEQAVIAAKGAVRLAKVNIDENPELAQAMRVQSVPTVYAFFQGQPVTGFNGNRPASDIQKLITQLVQMARQTKPDALDIPATMADAAKAMADNNPAQAQLLYSSVLEADENNAAAFAGLARAFIADGDVESAAEMLENAPDTIAKHPELAAARTAVELATAATNAQDDLAPMAQAVEKDPANHAARFDYAMALFGAGRREDAMTQLLHIIRADRTWEDEKARKQLVQFFDAIGPSDPIVATARRQLSSILFA